MYLLTAVLNNEELLEELITGWLDLGITDANVVETTSSVQFISQHIPIFAGFRTLTGGSASHNKTIFAIINDKDILDHAISFLKSLCKETGKPDQGSYFVSPVEKTGSL